MNNSTVFVKTQKAKNLHGCYVKVEDLAGIYASHEGIEFNANLTRKIPSTYIVDKTQWIPISDLLNLIDLTYYKDLFNRLKIYIFGEGKSSCYFFWEDVELISKYISIEGESEGGRVHV